MSVSPLEAVADAIMAFEGWSPGSRSYRNRNPGNLELKIGTRDEKGYSVFTSLTAGYTALLSELTAKFTGNNSHGIGPESTLLDLFNVYAPPSDNNPTNEYAKFVAVFISRALGKTFTIYSKLGEINA